MDDHNQLRQGFLSLESSWKTKKWVHRQFAFIFAVVEVNAFLIFQHFFLQAKELSFAEFCFEVAQGLFSQNHPLDEGYNLQIPLPTHVEYHLMTKPNFAEVW